ncbi:unnamed protein product [Polarella glacialis]|uniref:Uncharacterized protein n=1 Tax=Polarella glacialis TaxID=89957 RepID=A0A813HZE2_POLGL|nr:unnamed protein product [Polarella glacialis]
MFVTVLPPAFVSYCSLVAVLVAVLVVVLVVVVVVVLLLVVLVLAVTVVAVAFDCSRVLGTSIRSQPSGEKEDAWVIVVVVELLLLLYTNEVSDLSFFSEAAPWLALCCRAV